MHLLKICVAIASLATSAHTWASECNLKYWTTFKGTEIFRIGDGPGYAYITTHTAIDADGAPNAYHPDDTGLDKLANAGYPKTTWWKTVLAADPLAPTRPYVQNGGTYKGYFVSKTSLSDVSKSQTDPSRYVDASTVPYMVLPQQWYPVKGSGHMGDLAAAKAVNSQAWTPAILADTGGGEDAKLGEASIELFKRLGDPAPSPRSGLSITLGPVLYMVFPGSRSTPAWPASAETIKASVDTLIAKAGGWPAPSCFNRNK